MQKFIKTRNCWGIQSQRMVNQPEIVDFIKRNPGKTEDEIMYSVYGYDRYSNSSKLYINKKYADCLRRALDSGKIIREKATRPGTKRLYFVYSINNKLTIEDFNNGVEFRYFGNKYKFEDGCVKSTDSSIHKYEFIVKKIEGFEVEGDYYIMGGQKRITINIEFCTKVS